MTFVVPFDDSPLSRAALARASAFRSIEGEPLVAVSVIRQGNAETARERGWLADDEPFDADLVGRRLRAQVSRIDADAGFRPVSVGQFAPSGGVATELRRAVRDLEATMVFVGSERAGRETAPVGSIGRSLLSEEGPDVVLVRRREPEWAVSMPPAHEAE